MKAVLTKEEHGALGESTQGEYTAGENDVFVLDVEAVDGMALENVTGLKSALEKERSASTTLGKVAKGLGYTQEDGGAWKMGDIDPSKVAAQLKELDKLRAIDPKSEAGKLAGQQVEEIRKQLKESHEKEISDRDTLIATQAGQLDDAVIDREIGDALSEHKGSRELLSPIVRKLVKRVEKDGKQVTQVVDENGVPRVNNKADPMTVSELVADLKTQEAYRGGFEGTGHSGTGGDGDGDDRRRVTDRKPGDDNVHGQSRIERALKDQQTVAGAAGSSV